VNSQLTISIVTFRVIPLNTHKYDIASFPTKSNAVKYKQGTKIGRLFQGPSLLGYSCPDFENNLSEQNGNDSVGQMGIKKIGSRPEC
jgi:hypothetical protein